MRYRMTVLLGLFMAPLAAQTPTINSGGIVNAASQAPPGLPPSAIAQGSIFAINGRNFGSSLQGGSPLDTALGDTSVQVSVNGTSMPAPVVSKAAGQILAIMPSAIPTGSGTVRVTTSAGTSAAAAVQVTAGSFGIYTLNLAGSGPAQAVDANGNLISVVAPAGPGATLTILGTGLGALAADDVNPPAMNDISPQVSLYVGLEQAQVIYAGRSGNAPGQDEVTFTIPADAITGCYVPVAVVFNNVVSNWASIPIAADGVTCSLATVSATQIQQMQQLAASGGTVTLGTVGLSEDTVTGFNLPAVLGSLNGTTDTGIVSFLAYTPDQLAASFNTYLEVSPGGCLGFSGSDTLVNLTSSTVTDPTAPTGLDAGTVTLTAPDGKSKTSNASSPGQYSAALGSSQNGGTLFLNQSGTYTVSGTGGAAVGPWSVQIPAPPKLTWTNAASLTTVNRSKGLTVNWTGGDPNGIVMITGMSITNLSLSGTTPSGTGALFVCAAPVSAGTFVVPPVVTQSLPASGTLNILGANIGFSTLSVRSTGQWIPIAASGVTVGGAGMITGTSQAATFQ